MAHHDYQARTRNRGKNMLTKEEKARGVPFFHGARWASNSARRKKGIEKRIEYVQTTPLEKRQKENAKRRAKYLADAPKRKERRLAYLNEQRKKHSIAK